MNRLSRVIVLTLVCLVVAAPSVQAAPKSPFVGAWTNIDTDGSTQYLAISGGVTVRVTYTDLYGSICFNAGAPTNVFSGALTGVVAGDTLTATWYRARCGPATFEWLVGLPTTWTYDPASDVLQDESENIWTRR